VAAFETAARTGLEVGRGQTGGSLHTQPGLPAQVDAQLHHLAAAVFAHGYADAMRPTLVVPIALVLLAAVSTVAVRHGTRTPAEQTVSTVRSEPQSVA
jgi:hypothetical protein